MLKKLPILVLPLMIAAYQTAPVQDGPSEMSKEERRDQREQVKKKWDLYHAKFLESDFLQTIDTFRDLYGQKRFDDICRQLMHPYFTASLREPDCVGALEDIATENGQFKRAYYEYSGSFYLLTQAGKIEVSAVYYNSSFENITGEEEFYFSIADDGSYKLSNYEVGLD